VKHNRWTVLVASFVVVCFVASQAAAQALPNFVAVVDVAQLIKRHPDFKGKQDALQGEMLAKEAYFKQKQEAIAAKEKALQTSTLKQGSPEFQKAADEIQSDYADFEKEAKAEQRRFALKNSQIMYDTYKDIKSHIAAFATARNIAQVTDFRMFEPDPAIPQTVAEDMDQKLVWFDPKLDITELVLKQMYGDRPVPPKEAPGAAPVVQRTAAAPPQPPAASAPQPLR